MESLADGSQLHPLQQAFINNHALQCGFCTPGFLMLLEGALAAGREFSDQEIVDLLSSNLCRCTGYQNIVAAARAAMTELSSSAYATSSHECHSTSESDSRK